MVKYTLLLPPSIALFARGFRGSGVLRKAVDDAQVRPHAAPVRVVRPDAPSVPERPTDRGVPPVFGETPHNG